VTLRQCLYDFRWRRSWLIVRSAVLRSCLLFVLLAAGCATRYLAWRRVDQPTPLKSEDVVWIWGGGAANKWHAVVITQDSVSGVPYELPLPCDSCRHSLSRSQVDSMDVGYERQKSSSGARALQYAGVVILAILVEAGVCALIHADNQC